MEKYSLVKHHDRIGRMADTLEFSNVAFPRARFTDELIHEIQTLAPSVMELRDDEIILRHLYIEGRMLPLNIFLTHANEQALQLAIREYGNAIKQLASANIFAGDLLFKNFGITRGNRVVFYDYDEIEYLTDCNFRKIPAPRNEEDEMASEPWYSVAKNDIFPEEFARFLLTDAKIRQAFMQYHADLLDSEYWKKIQNDARCGMVPEVLPYPPEMRFTALFPEQSNADRPHSENAL